MAFKIKPLYKVHPESYPFYFFDTNVWIAVLRNNQYSIASKRFQPYIDFFEGIVNLNSIDNPTILKRVKNRPKIVVTSMLLSELINAYLRNVAMPAFLNCKPGQGNFKKDYREPGYTDYDKQLRLLVSDIQAFSFLFEYVDDSFTSLKPMASLDLLNREIDYNDMYFMKLMKKINAPIITDDKDFSFQDTDILTTNNELLKVK